MNSEDNSKEKILRLRYALEDHAHSPALMQILNFIDDDLELPFELPPEVVWPRGDKAKSNRALILMRCGLKYLEEKYEAKQKLDQSKDEKPAKAGASGDPFANL